MCIRDSTWNNYFTSILCRSLQDLRAVFWQLVSRALSPCNAGRWFAEKDLFIPHRDLILAHVFFAFELKCSIFLRRGSIVPWWGQIFLWIGSIISQWCSTFLRRGSIIPQWGSIFFRRCSIILGRGSVKQVFLVWVCVLRNCGVSASAQVVY